MTVPSENRIDDYLVYDKEQGTITVTPIINTLVPSGDTEITYSVTITITTIDYDGTPVSTDVTHTVTIKNPCIDTDFVNISLPATLANL